MLPLPNNLTPYGRGKSQEARGKSQARKRFESPTICLRLVVCVLLFMSHHHTPSLLPVAFNLDKPLPDLFDRVRWPAPTGVGHLT